MKLALITLAASAAAVSTLAVAASTSPLSPPPPSGVGLPKGECVRTQDFRNHTVADSRTLLIDVAGKDTYRVTMRSGCLKSAVSSDPIVTRSFTSTICRPMDLDIAVAKGDIPTRCIVDSIVRMSREDVAALPPRLRP